MTGAISRGLTDTRAWGRRFRGEWCAGSVAARSRGTVPAARGRRRGGGGEGAAARGWRARHPVGSYFTVSGSLRLAPSRYAMINECSPFTSGAPAPTMT
jgi:hypothetical protein